MSSKRRQRYMVEWAAEFQTWIPWSCSLSYCLLFVSCSRLLIAAAQSERRKVAWEVEPHAGESHSWDTTHPRRRRSSTCFVWNCSTRLPRRLDRSSRLLRLEGEPSENVGDCFFACGNDHGHGLVTQDELIFIFPILGFTEFLRSDAATHSDAFEHFGVLRF